jgi:hypothetical protein
MNPPLRLTGAKNTHIASKLTPEPGAFQDFWAHMFEGTPSRLLKSQQPEVRSENVEVKSEEDGQE